MYIYIFKKYTFLMQLLGRNLNLKLNIENLKQLKYIFKNFSVLLLNF